MEERDKSLYKVVFLQIYEYTEIEAESEDDAYEKAKKEFDRDMRYPISRTTADFYEVAEQDDDYLEFTL